MIEITPVTFPIKAGDTFVMNGKPIDDRTWWQKHVPPFLGGRADPTKDQTLVITAVTNSTTYIKGNPLCLTPDIRYRINGADQ